MLVERGTLQGLHPLFFVVYHHSAGTLIQAGDEQDEQWHHRLPGRRSSCLEAWLQACDGRADSAISMVAWRRLSLDVS